MKKRVIIALVVFVVLLKLSYSVTTFIVNETDLVKIVPKAYDPDDDQLSYFYSAPLDENGTWQTAYGDLGIYNITVTVTDGEFSTTEEVILVVNKKEEAPVIESYNPDAYEITADEGKKLDFSVSATDLNNDDLSYIWEMDGKSVAEGNSFTYYIDYEQQGDHDLKIYVSDGRSVAIQEWLIHINDIDRAKLLDQINNIEAKETERVSLNLPDFSAYDLEYTISDPIGDDNIWKTWYDNAGQYDVIITISDKEFVASKTISVNVIDVDRKPKFEPIGVVWMRENQKVTINLNATDPDGDEITYSAENLPEGADLNENIFTWYPGYDKVKREGWFNLFLDKYHLLMKAYRIRFIAESNELKDEKIVTIMVKDVNREPVVEPMEDIIIGEGDTLTIMPSAGDPDGDPITVEYSGWKKDSVIETDYGDSGDYMMEVTASDGWLSDSEEVFIRVEKVNRAPIFKKVPEQKVDENKTIKIKLYGDDPDGDNVWFYIEGQNTSLEDDTFEWTPHFDYSKKQRDNYNKVKIIASDGKSETEQEILILVNNVNRAPEIEETMPEDLITVKLNTEVEFKVVASDPDGDRLQYTWDFGMFDRLEAKSKIKRIFTTKGNKRVTVTVSDGFEETSYTWNLRAE